jgi:hypothetical protein
VTVVTEADLRGGRRRAHAGYHRDTIDGKAQVSNDLQKTAAANEARFQELKSNWSA